MADAMSSVEAGYYWDKSKEIVGLGLEYMAATLPGVGIVPKVIDDTYLGNATMESGAIVAQFPGLLGGALGIGGLLFLAVIAIGIYFIIRYKAWRLLMLL